MFTDTPFFLRGFILGLSIAAPVGPIGVLCIRRTLAHGRAIGFVSGLGAATADAVYGSIAGFGLTLVSTFLLEQQIWMRIIGGVFLIYLGLKYFFAIPASQAEHIQHNGLFSAYASTLILTLTNPLTILSFTAIFAGLGITNSGSFLTAGSLVLGVFSGSALWWLFLSAGISLLGSRFSLEGRRWTNRLSGMIITVFGLLALYSLI